MTEIHKERSPKYGHRNPKEIWATEDKKRDKDLDTDLHGLARLYCLTTEGTENSDTDSAYGGQVTQIDTVEFDVES